MKTKTILLFGLFIITTACASPQPTPVPAPPPPTTAMPSLAPTIASPLLTATPLPARATPPRSPAATPVTMQSLLAQARAVHSDRYQFAQDQGAQIVPTPDGKSFYLLWIPQNFRGTIIAALHGHSGWAFDEFFQWQPFAASRGHAILALQWWFGGDDKPSDYYQPNELYPIFNAALREQKIQPGKVLLHGFSRGSSNIYAVTALDRDSHTNWFGMTIANAGMPSPDYPPNVEIANGKYGANVFAGTHWVMYCGYLDPSPDSGCPGMRQARDWVTRFGGTVDLLIEDKNGDHGGFHRNPTNVNAALDVFDRWVKK